jgi:twitching motility protein PilJ
MEQTTSEVVGGARLAQDAGVALEEIEGVSANLAELIQNISNAARQQASSAGHISNTMNVIQEITSQTSAGTGATAQAIGDLADMALELRESVAGFTLPDELDTDIDDIDSDAWLSANDMALDDVQDEYSPDASLGLDVVDDNIVDDLAGLFDNNEEFNFETDDFESLGNMPRASAALSEDEYDFSEEMLSLAESEGVDLSADDFDLSDFDFIDEKEKDSVS